MLKRHQDIPYTYRPFECAMYHKIFICKGILHFRLRLHSEDCPFICGTCKELQS